ncbi:MAG: hypothetical protein AAFX85_14510 [Pseudomonadota bacterium]
MLQADVVPLLRGAGFREFPSFHFCRVRGYLLDVVQFDIKAGKWLEVWAHINPLYHESLLDALIVGGRERIVGSELGIVTHDEAQSTMELVSRHLGETTLPWFSSIPDLSHYLPKIQENMSKYYSIVTLALLGRHEECVALIEERLAKLYRQAKARDGYDGMIAKVEQFSIVLKEDRVGEFVDDLIVSALKEAKLEEFIPSRPSLSNS